MKTYKCGHCDYEVTINDRMPVEAIGPCSKCGNDDWREVKERTWECNGCDDGPCFENQEMKPSLCKISGESMVLSDDWREAKENPVKKHEPSDPAPMMLWGCKSYRNCDHRARCLCMVEIGKKPPDSAGCGEGSWREVREVDRLKREFEARNERADDSPVTVQALHNIEIGEKTRKIFHLEKDLDISHANHNKAVTDRADRDKEIERLKRRDESRLVDIAGIEADLGRAYDKQDVLRAKIIQEKKYFESLNDTCGKYRDLWQDCEKRLEAERKKKTTLHITVDNDNVDSFLKFFPGFKPTEPKQ